MRARNGVIALLTMLSVKYGSSRFLTRNAALCRALNPEAAYEWLVVNNDFDEAFAADPRFRVVSGVPAVSKSDRGSYHHAAGIKAGLEFVSSRYVLLHDHDFFVIRPDWVRELLEYVEVHRLAFFGSVWHPRWSYQPRGFPSVHFMLIDLEQVPVSALDFTPDMTGDRLDAVISAPHLPIPRALRSLLQVGRFRDTGWRVRDRFRRSTLRFECLVPHWNLEVALDVAPWLHRWLSPWLPDALNPLPRGSSALTDQSFLRSDSVTGYERGWEEFFWRGAPFGVHLRTVGRRAGDVIQDDAELDRLLELYRTRASG
jgi:hypothetical protein